MLKTLLLFIGCVLIIWGAYTLGRKSPTHEPVGTLRIDNSDPEETYMFLELETDPSKIMSAEYITLRVNTKSYISQK